VQLILTDLVALRRLLHLQLTLGDLIRGHCCVIVGKHLGICLHRTLDMGCRMDCEEAWNILAWSSSMWEWMASTRARATSVARMAARALSAFAAAVAAATAAVSAAAAALSAAADALSMDASMLNADAAVLSV
jgi:hypothetical protein